MVIPGRDVPFKQFVRDLYREIDCDYLLDFAGSVAYSAFLAIFPFLLFVVALGGLVIDPGTLDTIIDQIRSVVPSAVAEILTDRLHALTSGTRPGLLTLGAIGAIWAASGAVTALMTALNSAYDVRDSRPFWKTRGIALLVTIGGAMGIIVASSIAIATPAVANAIGGVAGALVLWLRWPVAALIMLTVIAVLYYVLPDVEQSFKFITPGSAIAVLLWILASLGFSLYVSHFGSYEVTYGALGSVIIFMLWIWISALVILLGAEVNSVIEQYSPEGKRTGAKSMADRGADAPPTEKRDPATPGPRAERPAP